MITHYEIYYTDENGQFVRAPNPLPPEWRERKGVCRHCGEKVFVKAGPLRSFWTHGKGKTCVKKANRVDEAITAAEEYASNRGALSAGDEALKAGFEEQIGSNAKRLAEMQEICGEQQPGTVSAAPLEVAHRSKAECLAAVAIPPRILTADYWMTTSGRQQF